MRPSMHVSSVRSPEAEQRRAPGTDAMPIYIIGITQRCGTHFLYDLLVRHPQCRPALRKTSWDGSWEDHLVEHAGLLNEYADKVTRSNHFNDDAVRRLLLRSLGDGLNRFVHDLDRVSGDVRRPVTKSPLSVNAELVPDLWPGASVVLLVRDPRAVVASAMYTFGGRPESWTRLWRRGARAFVRLQQTHPDQTIVVRYEDLFVNTEAVLSMIFARLGLSGEYDFASVDEMPVRGSSQLGGPARANHWLPMARTEEFDPLSRGEWLPRRVEQRIRWLTLPEMSALGYASPADEHPTGRRALVQRGATFLYACGAAARLASRALTSVVRAPG